LFAKYGYWHGYLICKLYWWANQLNLVNSPISGTPQISNVQPSIHFSTGKQQARRERPTKSENRRISDYST
jgi:hypothetical protein